MNLTEKSIERLQANNERQSFRDDEFTGLGIRVEPKSSGGRKSFFWNAKVAGQVVFKSLGEWPATSVKDAREKAKQWAGKASKWKEAGCPEDANPFAKPKKVVRTTTPLFSELFEAYIKNHLLDPEVGALNKERAEYNLRLLIKNHFNSWLDLPIDKITTDHVLAAKNLAKGRYAQNSVVEFARRLFTWSAGTNAGKVNYWRVGNPAKDIALNKPKARKEFLQPDELVRFNEQLKKEPHRDTRDVLALLLATGARKSNVYAMRWDNISEELKNWHVPMSKSGTSYEVPLTQAALDVLDSRAGHHGWPEKGFVFPASSRSGHVGDIKKRWKRFREAAGLPPEIRLHSLRRTKGSYAALSGESLQKIAAILGHESLGSTAIYARLNEESAREASLAGDSKMKQMMQQAKRRLKRAARKPKAQKLLAVANV
jgi:integrase